MTIGPLLCVELFAGALQPVIVATARHHPWHLLSSAVRFGTTVSQVRSACTHALINPNTHTSQPCSSPRPPSGMAGWRQWVASVSHEVARRRETELLDELLLADGVLTVERMLDVGVGEAFSSPCVASTSAGSIDADDGSRVTIRQMDRVAIAPSSREIGQQCDEGSKYDLCVASCALHHMPRAASLLSDLCQHLQPLDGRLLLIEALPRESDQPLLSCVVFGALSVSQGLPFESHHRRSRAEWRIMLCEAGYRVAEEREIAPSLAIPYSRVAFLARPRANS